MEHRSRLPVFVLTALMALVVTATGNLSGLGIGSTTLLYDSIALPRFVVTLVLALAAWAAWLLAEKDKPLRLDPTAALLGGLAALALLSAAVSPHRALALLGQSERLEGAITVVLYLAVYVIALQVVRRSSDVVPIAGWLAGCTAVLSVLGVAQYLGVDPTNYSFEQYGFDLHRAFATFGNPNFFAGLIVLALPVTIALAITARRRPVRVVWGVAALVTLAALFMTFTRGAWLAVALEVPVAVMVWRRTTRRARVTRTLLVSAVIAVAMLSALVIASLHAPAELNVASRVGEAFRGTGSASERSLLVGIALSAAIERPLVGYGPDTFLPAFRLHRSSAYAETFGPYGIVNNSHSWPLQYAATLGFIGAFLLVAAIVVALWRARGAVGRQSRADADPLRSALWIGCLGFAVHMSLSVSVLGATIPFFIVLGALGAPLARGRREVIVHAAARRAIGFAVAVACVAALGASLSLVVADAAYLTARKAFSAGDYATSLQLARRARAANPLSVKYARGTAEAAGALAEQAILGHAPKVVVMDAYEVAYDGYQRTLKLDPNDYPALSWLAALQARTAVYLGDEALFARSAATVRRGALLDVDHIEVAPLMSSPTEESINAAAGVRRLP